MFESSTLSVVVPCLNEADNLAALHAEIVAELGDDPVVGELEVLYVDDGSTDATLAVIRELAANDARVGYLSFTRNFGLEAAFSAGYRYARNAWVLHLDADRQFPPAEGRKLLEVALQGYDAVFGIRVDRQDHWARRLASRVNDLIARRLLRIELPPGATTFRVVRAELARRIVDLRLGTPYFLATVPKLTSAWTTVPTEHRKRAGGRAKVRFSGLARHAVELFFSHSTRLLTGAALVALIGGALGFLDAGLVAGDAPTRLTSTLLALARALGLVALAICARYLVHVGRGQARPPLYLIRETNLDVDDADLLTPRHAVARV